MRDRLVLALDGSTAVCSVALLRRRPEAGVGGSRWDVAARRAETDGQGQAKVLLRLVDEMLEETVSLPGDLGAVVVGTGPGTFTGVRITVATARAVSLALCVPVLGVSTLGALTAGAAAGAACAAESAAREAADAGAGTLFEPSSAGGAGMDRGAAPADSTSTRRERLLVPVVDAHRGQLFYGLYRAVSEPAGHRVGRWARSADFGVCDRASLGGLVVAAADDRFEPDGRRLSGDGAEIARVVGGDAVLAGELPAGVVFERCDVAAEWLVRGQGLIEEPGLLPQGGRLAPWLAEVLYPKESAIGPEPAPGAPGTPESVTPIYVRSPDADIHITKMRDPWADGSSRR
jgi:tRNA threonylcarbamoyl adenosine modification protein YeaZ